MERLDELGYSKYNLSLGESYKFEFKEYVGFKELIDKLTSVTVFGDIYAK